MSRLVFLFLLTGAVSWAFNLRAEEEQSKLAFDYLSHSKDAKVEEALQRKIQFDFKRTPLHKVMELLSKKLDLEIRVEERALDDIGLSKETPVTLHMTEAATLQTSLEFLLDQLDLTYAIDQGVIVITSPEDVKHNYQYTKYYHLAPVLGLPDVNQANLAEQITKFIDPASWDRLGGKGSVHAISQGIVVNQNLTNHRKVANFLEQYCQLAKRMNSKEPSTENLLESYPQRDSQLSHTLNRPLEKNSFHDTPLDQVLIKIAQEAKLPLLIDERGIDDIGLSTNTPIDIELEPGHSVRHVFQRILQNLELVAVQHADAIVITTHQEQDKLKFIRFYPLADFPVDEKTNQDQWVEAIRSNIEPEEWEELGGPGHCSFDTATKSLIVAHYDSIHNKIAQLLRQIRNQGKTPPVQTAVTQKENSKEDKEQPPVIIIDDSSGPRIKRKPFTGDPFEKSGGGNKPDPFGSGPGGKPNPFGSPASGKKSDPLDGDPFK
ncbi:MAG: hypothetical protein COA78_22380 [Blastopirellula sp.]|nr:MAG: hypothetical protein COA78_22380 [Blastopirellula sp.]